MQTASGFVSNIKILKFSERPLVFFKLDDMNCLIAARSLSFLADVTNGMKIAICGEYNNRKQLVVKKYAVIGLTKVMMDFKAMSLS